VTYAAEPTKGTLAYHSVNGDATLEVPIFGDSADPFRVTGSTTKSATELVLDRHGIPAWHFAAYGNGDPFTGGHRPGPLGGAIVDAADSENRIRMIFEALVLMGWRNWHFHDLDLLWPFETPQQYVDQMHQLAEIIIKLTDEFANKGYPGINVAWITSNTFSSPWTMLGGADTYFEDCADFVALQQKVCLDVGQKIGARGIVFWGGRNGLKNPWIDNPRFQTEIGDAIICATYAYGKANCPSIQYYMREPKGKEPCNGIQYDRDTVAANANWDRCGLLGKEGVGINLEPFCHAPMAGVDPFTEMCSAFHAGNWLATDLNQQGNSEIGWDDDVLFSDVTSATQFGFFDLLQGDARSYCLNNDARHRNSSNERGILQGYAGSADVTLLGLSAAAGVHRSGVLQPALDTFRAFPLSERGKQFRAREFNLEAMAQSSIARKALPKVRYGYTEDVNHAVQPFVTRASAGIKYGA
jgi:xylose isomerase